MTERNDTQEPQGMDLRSPDRAGRGRNDTTRRTTARGPDPDRGFDETGMDDLRAATPNDPGAAGSAQGNHGNTGYGGDDDRADPDDAKVTGQSRA
jgi:hypothetical protein